MISSAVTRVLVVGLGSIGRRHARLLSERDDVELVLCDREPRFITETAELLTRPASDQFTSYAAAQEAGCDVVFTCTPTSSHAIIAQEAVAADCDLFVEKPLTSDSVSARAIIDAAGVMVPHVLTEHDAHRVVQQARFSPLGSRSLDGAGADGDYGNSAPEEYIRHANEERLVIAQIEDPSAVKEVERIAAVEGINMLFFGPGDYSLALGIPGRYDDPQVDEARRRVAEAAHEFGLFAGTPASPDDLPRLVEMGYRYFNVSADVPALRAYLGSSLNEARKRIDDALPPTDRNRTGFVRAVPPTSFACDGRPPS